MYGAVAAAAAAFAGLLFVALTVNLPRILPDAAHVALGLAAVLAAVSIRLQGQTIRRLPSGRRARWAVRNCHRSTRPRPPSSWPAPP